MIDELAQYLAPTYFIDSDHASVRAFAERATEGASGELDRAARLFRAVRDGLRYDPYRVSRERADYRASAILERPRAYCIPKAIVLVAGARALGIAARLGFADVENHLSSPRLRARMGTDLFVYHGYSELFLLGGHGPPGSRSALAHPPVSGARLRERQFVNGRWVKATPAFDRGLCEHFGVAPLELDGVNDAVLQALDSSGRRMKYVRERGTFADLPFDAIARAFVETYGERPVSSDDDDEAFEARPVR